MDEMKRVKHDESICDDEHFLMSEDSRDQHHQQNSPSIDLTQQHQKQQQHCHRTNSSNLAQDEILITEIRKFPCLYDRSNPEYKQNESTQDAWSKIREECTWIENNDEAARLFEVLKKRYSKKKMDYKRARVTAKESLLTKKTQLELEKYYFMRWMEPFIRFRTTKLVTEKALMSESKSNDSSHDEYLAKYSGEYSFEPTMQSRKRSYDKLPVVYKYSDGRPSKQNMYYEDQTKLVFSKQSILPSYQRNTSLNSSAENVSKQNEAKRKPPVLEESQIMSTTQNSLLHDTGIHIQHQTHHHRIQTSNQFQYADYQNNGINSPTSTDSSHKSNIDENYMNNNNNKNNGVQSSGKVNNTVQSKVIYETRVLKDEDELFSALIVSEMRNLNERMKYIVKHRISNVLFDALSEQFSQQKQDPPNSQSHEKT